MTRRGQEAAQFGGYRDAIGTLHNWGESQSAPSSHEAEESEAFQHTATAMGQEVKENMRIAERTGYISAEPTYTASAPGRLQDREWGGRVCIGAFYDGLASTVLAEAIEIALDIHGH